ncbi:MAG: HK97 gp10 family phage protein [Gemmatimonadota bacterium]
MADLSVQITGLDALLTNVERIATDLHASIAGAMSAEAEVIMAEAKALTPVDTGALRASGHVNAPLVSGHTISVTMGFGGAAVDYALTVHENLEAHHPVGQAKYLEQPLMAAAKTLPERIAARVRL